MRSTLALWVGAVVLAAPVSVEAQSRPLRLFFSTIGLSNPLDTNSPALNPEAQLGTNPVINVAQNSTVRLYIWSQITPPGTPNNVTYNGVSLRTTVSGAGGHLSGMSFWNYSNSTYRRWETVGAFYDNPQQARMNGSFFTGAAGVSNSTASNSQDAHYKRWTSDASTRIDATLLAYIDVTGDLPGNLELKFSIGQFGVSQSGQGVQPVYLGWGDEAAAPLSNQLGASSPLADATIIVAPEPTLIALLSLGAIVALRRR